MATEQLSKQGLAPAKALGWFSVGLGLAEITAPRQLANLIGTNDQPKHVLRALGVREVANGAMLLRKPSRTWLWTRVAGDIIDLALLAAAYRSLCVNRKRLTAATAAVGAVTLLDILAAAKAPERSAAARASHVIKVITINRPVEEVRAAWPSFERRTDVDRSGSVAFLPAPGGRGTEVRVELDGRAGHSIEGALRRFKQVLETGEVVHSDASIHSGMHPAQPSEGERR